MLACVAPASTTIAVPARSLASRRVAPGRAARPRGAALVTRAGANQDAPKKTAASAGKAKGGETSGSESSTGGILVSVGAVQVSVPPTVAGAGGALLAVALLRGALRGGRRKGSVGALEERGALDENRDVDEEKFFKGMMKTVRTVEMPELTDAQIQAARERRRQSRAAEGGDPRRELKAAELPKNHPFATSEATDAAAVEEQARKVREMNKPRRRQRGTPPPRS